MKVDKNKLLHWVLLIISAANIFISMPFRLFKKRDKNRVVFFYQIDGNVKAFVDYIQSNSKIGVEAFFLAFPEYLGAYKGKHNLPTLNMLSLRDMIKVARSDVVITNYGALTLRYYAKFTGIKFVDVWHGLPMLKNQTPKIMGYLNYYSEVWVSSESMKKFYVNRYKLKCKIVVTGYARVDRLYRGDYDVQKLRFKYDLPVKKIILIAPTWRHDNPDRSVLPFGLKPDELALRLNSLAEATNSFVIFRAHMLSGDAGVKSKLKNIKAMPSNKYPFTEELLAVSDLVVTDWSSLVFDFLATSRPIIFINGHPPFTGPKGAQRFTPTNRFGPIVNNFDEFSVVVKDYLVNPTHFNKKFYEKIQTTTGIAYGDTLDGESTKRYYNRLKYLLES